MQSRRHFLKQSMALPLMMGGGSLLGSLASINAQAADTSGYRALVCVFLFGGMDCHDTVLPYDQSSYNDYADVRRTLLASYATLSGGAGRGRENLLPLQSPGQGVGARQFALPPEMAGLAQSVCTGPGRCCRQCGASAAANGPRGLSGQRRHSACSSFFPQRPAVYLDVFCS